MRMSTVRRYALSLPEVTEAPHHDDASFRFRGGIFVTVPPAQDVVHVFVDDDQRERALAMYPHLASQLMWGAKARGVRVTLAAADAHAVKALVRAAYEKRVAKR